MPNFTCPSLQIFGKISDGAFNEISGFPVKSLINKNCHTSDPVVILTRNLDHYLKVTRQTRLHQQKSDNDVLSACYAVIAIFQIFVRFGESWIPERWYKFYLKILHLSSTFQPTDRWLEKMCLCLK